MKEDSKSEQNTKIDVKLFVTNLCPQCVIAIDRIDRIARNNKQIDVEIVNVSNGSAAAQQFEKLTDTPYFLIQEKYVVPGTSSVNYILNVLKTAGATI
ncbi:hypothetical protein E3V33_05665 [Candidatus Marinimicrobia bacterium MT.SAG.4]|nr:hypothetical protein E3V33_05665 [Candidatus Marinimicrobia bacterium MT.SAG.4]